MNKKKKYPASRLYYTFILTTILVGIFIIFIGIGYRPYYKFFVGEEFIGYYKSYKEYEEIYNSIEKEINVDGVKGVKYFISNPYCKIELQKESYVNNFDNYTLIDNQMKKDYNVYKIIINGKSELYTKTKEEAEKIVKQLKEKVKASTEIEIKETIINDLSQIDTKENINKKIQLIINNNKKLVTSRGGAVVRKTNSNYLWPTTSNTITSYFGPRWGRTHTGIDIGVATNSPIYAMRDGIVILSCYNGGYGYQVKIQHSNGVITTYGHNSKLLVKKGDKVVKGQVIARSGSTGNSTGPHTHIEFIVNGEFKNPLNYL